MTGVKNCHPKLTSRERRRSHNPIITIDDNDDDGDVTPSDVLINRPIHCLITYLSEITLGTLLKIQGDLFEISRWFEISRFFFKISLKDVINQ